MFLEIEHINSCVHCGRSFTSYKPRYLCPECMESQRKRFNQKIEKHKERKMGGFKREDIKAGYVVRLRSGETKEVVPVGEKGTLILLGVSGWGYLGAWNGKFDYMPDLDESTESTSDKDIVEVYGYTRGTENYANIFNDPDIAEHRPLLWKRAEPKKLTVSQISDLLGYPVEIIKEG